MDNKLPVNYIYIWIQIDFFPKEILQKTEKNNGF